MKKLTFLISAVLLASNLIACSDKPTDEPIAIETKELPIINMVSTHDIDLDISVSQLTFVPNSEAPWLGRIILRDDAGRLFSTDIEGREPKPVGNGKYIDIFGLARKAAPGVFLAITEDNKIEAFIESDDIGNFSPLIFSGTHVAARAFCVQKLPTDSQISYLTSKGDYMTIGLTISDNHIRQELLSPQPNAIKPDVCKFAFPAISQLTRDFAVQSGTPSGLFLSYAFPMKDNQKLPVLEAYRVNINSGLSVRGVERIKFIATTQSNYGGGAYADGVLALVDKDANRIVFISMSYAERQLLKAVNQPEEAPQ